MSYNASSTYKSFLMRSTDGETYTKVIDIKTFPDMGGEPSNLQTTTMTDGAHTGIPGLQALQNLAFTANYDKTQFTTLDGYATSDESADAYYALWFGGTEVSGSDPTPTGADGKFSWKGRMAHPYVTGKGVDEVREINIVISKGSKIQFSAS